MANTKSPAQDAERTSATLDAARVEAEERAHDRVSPDATLDPIGAVNLYVEAFLAGAQFAADQLGGAR